MSGELFQEGGELNTRRTGQDQYEMSISIPSDEDGRVARECHADECSPAYFKVMPGTGLSGAETAFCPYCRHEDAPNNFFTTEQLRYAKERLLREAHSGVSKMLKNALGIGPSGRKSIGGGLISIEMSLKEGPKPQVFRPLEEEVRRDVICPNCGLDQSVYGLATWCADCGKDIFLSHVEAEMTVVRSMLSDVERRRELLGRRIAAKDTENCLEDVVSIFEAVLRIMVRRRLVESMADKVGVKKFFKEIGNAFQNLERTATILEQKLGIRLMDCLSADEFQWLGVTFNKRHPITHNLGVIDRKYLERAMSAEQEGKEVLITVQEVEKVIILSMKVFYCLHSVLFPKESHKT